MSSPDQRETILFAYGSLLKDERDHELLAESRFVGYATTVAKYQLVDLDVYAALIAGRRAIDGELYAVDLKTRGRVDVRKEHPILFERTAIELADGSEAHAYLMKATSVAGKRRLHVSSWRDRFAPRPRQSPGPFADWLRKRRP